MGVLSHKKWKICIALLLVLLILFSINFFLRFNNTTYPYEKGARWVCSDPHFELEYRMMGERLVEQSAFLEIDGVLQPVDVFYQSNSFIVHLENPEASGYHYNDRLLEGTWKYRGKKLVFYIDDDFVFDGAYKKIIFSLEE